MGHYVFLFIILILFCELCLTSFVVKKEDCPNEKDKCTPKDPRQTYPRCMLYTPDLSLWCDQSNYVKIPDPDRILPHNKCREARALYINDSCLAEIDQDDLQKFVNITVFLCGRNYIKTLKNGLFSHNRQLETIDFCTNKIEDIENKAFAGLSKLKVLNLKSNKIANIQDSKFRYLTSLVELCLHNNEISVVHSDAFYGLKSLRILRLSGNSISHIDETSFHILKSLTHLHLDDNQLKRIEGDTFVQLTSLQVLTVSYNKLEDWPEGITEEVHTLNFDYNMITELRPSHIANMTKLQNLSLENNSLSSLSENLFLHTPRMRYLNLADNYIEDIPRFTFTRLCHLETIVLRNNQLQTPYADWFRNIISNNQTVDNDITENKWKCDCDVIEHLDFVENLQKQEKENPEMGKCSESLQITCNSPKSLSDEKLNSYARNVIEGEDGCQKYEKSPTIMCDSSQSFTREPKIYIYTLITEKLTTTPEMLTTRPYTDTSTSVSTFGGIPFYEKQEQNGGDPPFLPLGIVAVVIFFILCVVFLLWKKRVFIFAKKAELDIDEKDTSRSQAPSSNRFDDTVVTTVQDPYDRLDHERKVVLNVTQPSMPSNGASNVPSDTTSTHSSEHSNGLYTDMQPVRNPNNSVTTPKSPISVQSQYESENQGLLDSETGAYATISDPRIAPDGRSLNGSPHETIPKEIKRKSENEREVESQC